MKYKLEFVGVLQGMWDKGGTVIIGDYIFIYGKELKPSVGKGIFCKPQNRVSS